MAVDGKDSPERDRTDEGLRKERRETDRALANRQAAVEEDADLVVQHARQTADAVLTAARDEADQHGRGASQRVSRAAVEEIREREDEAVLAEREAADESLRRARAETARALKGLLPLERERTDRYLLTERVRSDEALSHRDDFLGIVSHDLRDLLGGIVMSASLLAPRAGNGEIDAQTLAQVDRIQRYAARMNRLIGDLLDVASLDAGKLALTPTPGDAAAVISEAVDTFRAVASGKEITLETENPGASLLCNVDHARILQVLANLLTNAIKFTPRGGAIRVHGEQSRGELRLRVSDTGIGIPAHLLESVFERFWQVGVNDRRGLGLGLYISRSIVEAHGGRIWAESTEGAGSTFVVTLPAAAH